MTTQHTPYLLKVVSGSNSGALVRLKVGELVIGRSMASDIILHDEGIADLHAKLKVNEDLIILEALAEPIQIDGRPMTAKEVALKPYEAVTLGGSVEFFIADVRKPGGRRADGSYPETGPAITPAERASLNTGTLSRDKAAQQRAKAKKSGSAGGKVWFLLGLGLLVVANLLFFKPFIGNFAEKIGLRETNQQRAESVLDTLKTEGLTVTRERDGRAVISGYVDSRAQKTDLMTQAMKAGEDINYRIWVRQDLVDGAERVARALGQPDLHFKSIQQGKLAANGYVSSEEDWARIKTNIMRDVSGIQAIDDIAVQTLIKRKDALVQFVDKKGLSSRVKVTIDRDRIRVDGELTQAELANWSTIYQEFVAEYGVGPAMIENLQDARSRIKLAIRSVSVGETPFLVSKDGKKYMEGSSLGNDYFIKKITPDQILLTNNGIEISIPYGAESN